ncbi:polyprotein [Clonorchis sinensis]|uniref:Polyprotein n=1 Tax=Clonorchis sinensis TaxID=79923 RepID=G7Y9Q4_CLOSI|nr:polyprotein [Clonorchis sinensis]
MFFQHDYMIPERLLIFILLLSEGAHQFSVCKPVNDGHVLGQHCKSGKFRWQMVENKMLKHHFMVTNALSVEVCMAICEIFPECGAFDWNPNEQCLSDVPPEGVTRTEVLPGFQSLDTSGRDAEIKLHPVTELNEFAALLSHQKIFDSTRSDCSKYTSQLKENPGVHWLPSRTFSVSKLKNENGCLWQCQRVTFASDEQSATFSKCAHDYFANRLWFLHFRQPYSLAFWRKITASPRSLKMQRKCRIQPFDGHFVRKMICNIQHDQLELRICRVGIKNRRMRAVDVVLGTFQDLTNGSINIVNLPKPKLNNIAIVRIRILVNEAERLSGSSSNCSFCASVTTLNTSKSVFKLRKPVYLATFNVRMLKQADLQVAFVLTLDLLCIDVCCLSGTRMQDASIVIELTAPSVSSRFRLRTSGDTVAAASGYAGVGVVFNDLQETSLLDWILVDGRLCAVRLATSVRGSRGSEVHRTLFIVSAYAPTDCSSESTKESFYDADGLLQRSKSSDVVVVAGDMNAQKISITTKLTEPPFPLFHFDSNLSDKPRSPGIPSRYVTNLCHSETFSFFLLISHQDLREQAYIFSIPRQYICRDSSRPYHTRSHLAGVDP